MSALIVWRDGQLIVVGKKHNGKTLSTVADEDIGYLKFIFRKATEELPDDVCFALHDALISKGVDLKNL